MPEFDERMMDGGPPVQRFLAELELRKVSMGSMIPRGLIDVAVDVHDVATFTMESLFIELSAKLLTQPISTGVAKTQVSFEHYATWFDAWLDTTALGRLWTKLTGRKPVMTWAHKTATVKWDRFAAFPESTRVLRDMDFGDPVLIETWERER